MGQAFRMSPQPEAASQNPSSKRVAFSQLTPKRKPRPRISPQSGTRFPDGPSSGNYVPFRRQIPGQSFRKQRRPHNVAFDLYMFSGCPHDKPRSNNKASARAARNVRFIASSARAGEHLMCSPCEQDCPSRESYIPRRPGRRTGIQTRYLILVVPGARLGSVSLASVWKCSV